MSEVQNYKSDFHTPLSSILVSTFSLQKYVAV